MSQNPLTVPLYQKAICGHPQFVCYVYLDTASDRRLQVKEVPCPFCRAAKLQGAIEEALIHVKGQCNHLVPESGKDTTDCFNRMQTILESAIERNPA